MLLYCYLSLVTKSENGTNIFQLYSRPNSFRKVQIVSESGYSTSDTVSVSEYSNRIFVMSIV
jgi:hypothetical protein